MQFFEILEQKLTSDIDITKRIKLAQNSFITSELSILHKEEIILSWFLKTYLAGNDEDRENLIKGFEYCISSNHMKILPSSAVRPKIKADIISDLRKLLKNMKDAKPSFVDSVTTLIKTPVFSSHFRKHPKKFIEILNVLLRQCSASSQKINLLNSITEIFNSHLLKEKFINVLLKKGLIEILRNMSWEKEVNSKLIHLFQMLFFKKSYATGFQNVLNQVFLNNAEAESNELLCTIIQKLHETFVSDIVEETKANAFNLWFQAFAKSCSDENSSYILKFFISLCHLIGIEQLVIGKQQMIVEENFQQLFGNISTEPSSESYLILKLLLVSLSEYSIDLSENINGLTYLQWFQMLILKLCNESKLDGCHMEIFGACAEMNPGIIEATIGEIMTGVLSQSKKTFTTFQLEYEKFMVSLLRIFSKLQRFPKFIAKVLPSIRNTKSKLKVENILTNVFIQEFRDIVTILPSLQCLSVMEVLLQELDVHCVKILEEKPDESLNALFLQVISDLLTAFFLGVKVLSHSIPQSILDKFLDLMNKLKLILKRFGIALLSRTHDRNLVRPFLKICFYWGEMETLITFYSPERSEELVTRDLAPTDLSVLHSYLDGSQWSVLAERISNFGAGECNQLFLKLVLQKLRISKLRKNQTVPNVEVTSKYILIQLTSELYRHNIVEELCPEDINLIIGYLAPNQTKLLVEKLLTQLREHEDKSKLNKWILDPTLQENPDFVTAAFSVIAKNIFDYFKINESNGSSFASKLFSSFGFFDENNDIVHDDLDEFSENLKEIMMNPKKIRKKSEELNGLVEVLTILPLPYVPSDVRPLVLVLVTGLAFIYPKDKKITEDLLKIIYNLLNNEGEISSYLDVGLCVKWLVGFEDWREETKIVRYKIIEVLIKSSVITKKGLEEVGGLVKTLKKRKIEDGNNLLETEVLVYLDLGKSWQRSKKFKSENDLIGEYRKIVSKCMKKKLESINGALSQINNDVLLKAYSIVLTTAVRSKNEEEIDRILGLNFENYFDFAIKDLEKNSRNDGSVMFLSSLINCLPDIRSKLPRDVVKKIWPVLKFRDVDWGLFCKSFSDEEFDWLINDLLSTKQILLTHEESDPKDLQACFSVWQSFLSEKTESTQKHLEIFFCDLQNLMPLTPNLDHEKTIHLLRFLHFCTGKSEIRMTSFMIDSLFDVVLESRFDDLTTGIKFHDVFSASVDILISCVSNRYAWIQDKTQNLFQIFNFLLQKLVKRSDLGLDLNDDDLSLMATSAYHLERCSKALVDKFGKTISKVAPYFIAEIIFAFVTVSIYPVIKVHLTNCVNNFLSISDSHGITYLLRVLSPACQQVFQKIYDHYKKYYQFTGKV